MKAKIEKTGEIITVRHECDSYGRVRYRDCSHQNGELYDSFELDFKVDNQKSIDWEQRRYEIAKAVIGGLEVNSQSPIESDCKLAVEIADEMIKQLKEEKNDV